MLHIINKSCDQSGALEQCLKRAHSDDCILLIEDAVLCACSTVFSKLLIREGVKIFALKPDMQIRGLREVDCALGLQYLDYAGFVELTVRNNPVRSWF